MAIDDENQPIRIGFLLTPGFALMSYAAAIEPLRAANLVANRSVYEWCNVSSDGASVASSSGLAAESQFSIGQEYPFDYVFVCAGGNPFAFESEPVLQWLRKLAHAGVVIGGISGGPVLLAKAGIVGLRRITVHWEHVEALQEAFPDLIVDKTLYVMDRDRITCAGGIAPIDMMHALISIHHGSQFALQVSDWFLHTQIRAASGAQRSRITDELNIHHPALIAAIEFMQNRLADPAPLSDIAASVGLSKRQLGRLFLEFVGPRGDGILPRSPARLCEPVIAAVEPEHYRNCLCQWFLEWRPFF